MASQLTRFAAVLSSFKSSSDLFRVVASVPTSKPRAAASSRSRPRLYVLDSSFNPPTRAHLQIALSALLDDTENVSKHLLLLLATTNADKAAKPASFDQRLMLMNAFASELIERYKEARPASDDDSNEPQVDICLTKQPYFADKAAAIADSNEFDSDSEQVHLIGYDTLIRIFNPKYYPPDHTLAPLEPFLSKHRLRVTYRTNDEWGDRAEEEAYVQGISKGSLAKQGGKVEWAKRIKLVEGQEDPISSTKARSAAKDGDVATLKKLVSASVADWIVQQKLYQE